MSRQDTATSGEPGSSRPDPMEEAMASGHRFGDQPTPPQEGELGSRSNPIVRGPNSQAGLASATTRLGGPDPNDANLGDATPSTKGSW